jgi:hypothetical protein
MVEGHAHAGSRRDDAGVLPPRQLSAALAGLRRREPDIPDRALGAGDEAHADAVAVRHTHHPRHARIRRPGDAADRSQAAVDQGAGEERGAADGQSYDAVQTRALFSASS